MGRVTSDKFILDAVKHYKIEFCARFPQQACVLRETKFSSSERAVIDNEIDKLL